MSSRVRTIIAVAGGSGSGKTTFARRLAERLNAPAGAAPSVPVAAILSQDNYYIDQSRKFVRDGGDEVNFDHPDAIEFSLLARHLGRLRGGDTVEVPIYDFPTHTRSRETLRFEPCPVVIVDGILILTQPEVVSHFDDVVFLDVDEELRFERRFKRDTIERGRSAEGVREQFLRQVKPMHDQFVQPSARHARRLIRSLEDFDRTLEKLAAELLSMVRG